VPESVGDPLGYYFNNTVKSRELIASAVRPVERMKAEPLFTGSIAAKSATTH